MSPQSWLSIVDDELPLIELPILPGSHNSGTCDPRYSITECVFTIARQQHLSVKAQLESGVRLLDIRIRYDEGKGGFMFRRGSLSLLRVVHTLDTRYTLEEVLTEIKIFLDTYSTEFVIVLLRGDWPPHVSFAADSGEAKVQRVTELGITLKNSGLNWADAVDSSTRVGDIRGMALLLSDWFHEGLDSSLLQVPFLDKGTVYQVCDIWDDHQGERPAVKISRFMQSTRNDNVGMHLRNREERENPQGTHPRVCDALPGSRLLTGVALDRTHAYLVPPCLTSPAWNEWFANELELNPSWRPQMDPPIPIGVVLIDFADRPILRRLLDVGFKMMGKPNLAIEPSAIHCTDGTISFDEIINNILNS